MDNWLIDLTKEEEKAIKSLERLSKRWPETLWLFSGSGSLLVMKYGDDGHPVMTASGAVDQDYIVGTIEIPNDGGDF